MSIPILQPKLVLGLRTKPKGNVQYIGDDDIVYPVGAVLAVHNYVLNKQKFIKLPERGNNVNLITVSPNK